MLAFLIIIIPFIGTAAGSATVFFMKSDTRKGAKKPLLSFAAGVMLAAGVWSLLIPSIEMANGRALLAWLPAVTGFAAGIGFLLITEKSAARLARAGRIKNALYGNFMLFLAVTLHNIPEGMAVGVACAGLTGGGNISAAAAAALSMGIAVQNIPEGAIISMPAQSAGGGKVKSFILGVLSGAVEPAAAVITMLFTAKITLLLPYLLAFAAGAMFYVTVEDLIPECKKGQKSGAAAIFTAAGFVLMMTLDVAFG